MLKSPEEFLSDAAFDPPEPDGTSLLPGERAFVEKYLGMSPEDLAPLLQPAEPEPAPLKPALKITPVEISVAPTEPVAPPLVIEVVQEIPAAVPEPIVTDLPTPVETFAVETPQVEIATEEPAAEAPEPASIPEEPILAEATPTEAREQVVPESVALREKLKTDAEIQLVSFFIADQLFLLPVGAIHEVVRHMELIKIPQAPEFIAGAINLRGAVLPLVHLSALLTNQKTHGYDENKFVIICGTDSMRMGLVIDRISGMHWLAQKKIIWNMESKLGDAGEFLYAIADLNDKVCGIVSPETIAQKILSS